MNKNLKTLKGSSDLKRFNKIKYYLFVVLPGVKKSSSWENVFGDHCLKAFIKKNHGPLLVTFHNHRPNSPGIKKNRQNIMVARLRN